MDHVAHVDSIHVMACCDALGPSLSEHAACERFSRRRSQPRVLERVAVGVCKHDDWNIHRMKRAGQKVEGHGPVASLQLTHPRGARSEALCQVGLGPAEAPSAGAYHLYQLSAHKNILSDLTTQGKHSLKILGRLLTIRR